MTIRELAQLAGVSTSTVSKALNDSYQDISEETRERIRTIALENNYYPNQMASAMVRRKSQNIALIIPNISNPFFSEVAKGVTDYAYSMGINAILCNTENDVNRENKHLMSLAKGMVDGFIITPTEARTTGYDGVVPASVPIVLLGCSIWMERCYNTVRTDNTFGSLMAVEYLIEMGHKEILYVGGSVNSMINKLRLDGYTAALQKHNIAVDPRRICLHKFAGEAEGRAIEYALDQGVSFSAVFCVNDLAAYAVMRTLKHRGFRIPEDISLVGFDDLPLTSDALGLTSVHQPKYRMGHEAAKNLITLIEGGQVRDILLEPVLKKRSSVAQI